jgi:pentatricopeptide repeat protein
MADTRAGGRKGPLPNPHPLEIHCGTDEPAGSGRSRSPSRERRYHPQVPDSQRVPLDREFTHQRRELPRLENHPHSASRARHVKSHTQDISKLTLMCSRVGEQDCGPQNIQRFLVSRLKNMGSHDAWQCLDLLKHASPARVPLNDVVAGAMIRRLFREDKRAGPLGHFAQVLKRLHEDGVRPGPSTQTALRDGWRAAGDERLAQYHGRKVHATNAVICATFKNGGSYEGRRVTEADVHKMTVSKLAGPQDGPPVEADDIEACLENLQDPDPRRAIPLNDIVAAAAITALSKAGRLDLIPKVVQQLAADGVEPGPSTYAALINSYGIAGQHDESQAWLDEMTKAGVPPDFKAYEPIIATCARTRPADAFYHYQQMRNRFPGAPATSHIYTHLLIACSATTDDQAAEELLREMKAMRIELTQVHFRCLMSAHAARGGASKAAATLAEMGKHYPLEQRDYLTLFDACGRSGGEEAGRQALEAWQAMRRKGVALDLDTIHGYIRACGRCGNWQDSWNAFQECFVARPPRSATSPTSRTYDALIAALGANGQVRTALDVFESLAAQAARDPAAPQPSVATYTAAMQACEAAGRTADVAAYFKRLRANHTPDLRAYLPMLRSCVASGDPRAAMDALRAEMMEARVAPEADIQDEVVAACGSHAALLELGFHYLRDGVERGLYHRGLGRTEHKLDFHQGAIRTGHTVSGIDPRSGRRLRGGESVPSGMARVLFFYHWQSKSRLPVNLEFVTGRGYGKTAACIQECMEEVGLRPVPIHRGGALVHGGPPDGTYRRETAARST